MQAREMKVPGVFEFVPRTFPDDRGMFVAPFQEAAFVEAVGHPLHVAQTNHSVSRRGTIRGLHFADVPPGQAKYVHVARGLLLDVVVDLRVGSPTFGRWDAVTLDATLGNAIYVPEGVGHAAMALEDDTTMHYLCSRGFNPAAEHGITPVDPALGLPWPDDVAPVLSEKDAAAPTLAEALEAGLLPRHDACTAWYAHLRGE
jgi:dTDP-4-dehydrorhamnose 3,5-epimerase